MKLLFVQPFILPPVKSTIFKILYRYYSHLILIVDYYQILLQIAAVTPRKHLINLVDERFEKINFDEECNLVVITTSTGFAMRAYEIADEFRRRGKKVVLGGYHPTMMPNEAKQHADSVLVGEVELTWPQLLKDFENDCLKPFYKQIEPIPPEKFPEARRDIIYKYRRPFARIQATRGCPIGCEFCRVPAFEGRALRKRPIENVVEEVKSVSQKIIFFIDGSLTLDPEYTKALFRELRGSHKRFLCCGNTDVLAEDDELLFLAKKAGVVAWYVGFESLSQKIIDDIGKKTNIVEKYHNVVKKIHRYKMAVSGSFILGFDNDNLDIIDKTYNALYDLELDLAEINTLTPYPGTPLFERLDKSGRIISKNWFHYREGQTGTIPPFQPLDMSAEELQIEIRRRLFDKWYGSIDQRKLQLILKGMKFGFYPFFFRIFGSFFQF